MTELPRVLFAIGSLERGGSENQLFELIRAGQGREFEAALMTFGRSDELEREQVLAGLGVERVRLSAPGGPRVLRPLVALPRVIRHVRRLRPDVIYPWLEPSALILAPAARLCRVPLVVGRRNIVGALEERLRPVRWLMRACERSATLVTANSRAVLDNAVARGVRRKRLRLVPNGHRVVAPLPAAAPDPVVIGYVAHYRSEKGHMRLLSALERLPREPAWRVDLAGFGPLEQVLAGEIAGRGLGDRVRMVGQLGDARSFWSERHVAALFSDHEGSPNALIEAALCGRPLAGTNVGGTREVVADGCGLLFEPDDVPAIAAGLERLVSDAALRDRLGRQAYEHAAAHYTIESSLDGHVAVIREAVTSG